MTPLARFMAAKNLTDLAAAEQLGVSRPYLTRLRNGSRKPSLDVALKIETWSEGKVTAASMAGAGGSA